MTEATTAKAPIDIEFRVPFCVDVPVTLRSTVTSSVRFRLQKSAFCIDYRYVHAVPRLHATAAQHLDSVEIVEVAEILDVVADAVDEEVGGGVVAAQRELVAVALAGARSRAGNEHQHIGDRAQLLVLDLALRNRAGVLDPAVALTGRTVDEADFLPGRTRFQLGVRRRVVGREPGTRRVRRERGQRRARWYRQQPRRPQ